MMKKLVVAGMSAMLLIGGCTDRAGSRQANELPDEPWSGGQQGTGGNKMQGMNEEQKDLRIKEHKSGEWSPDLDEDEKRTLFAIAEDTLKWCVSGSRKPFSFEKYSITPKLKEETATFVTLKIGGALRGCIGSLMPVASMYKSVHDNTVNAAMRDFRFTPVRRDDMGKIDLHISLLSPIRYIDSLDEFKIGEHGIIIEKPGCRGAVYLPEVALEQNWTKEETLSSLCLKGGMNRDAWREGAKFKVFSSVVLAK